MEAFEFRQLQLYNQELLELQKMNFITVYLALVVAIHFVGSRLNKYLLSSVLFLFTLFSIESVRDYTSLLGQALRLNLAVAEEYGDKIPTILQNPGPFQILGVPLGLMTNYGIFVFGWLSVVAYAIYKQRVQSDD